MQYDVNGCFIAVSCEWILFSTRVFLVNCFLKCAAIILACSFSLMVNPPVSILIMSRIFDYWRWISFITRSILEESFLLFSVSFRRLSNSCLSSSFIFWWIVFMILFRSFWRLFFEVLTVTFSIFSLISWFRLDSRGISSFTWKRCFGFFPRTVSIVSFIAWAISFHFLSLMFGRLRNFKSSLFCIDQQWLCCLGYQGLLVLCISFWVGRAISFCMTSSRVYDRTVSSFLSMSEH